MHAQVHKRTHLAPPERRQNEQLRERFDFALELLKPMLGDRLSLNGTGLYRVMSRLQTTYPELSASEIEALVAAVVRAYESRGR